MSETVGRGHGEDKLSIQPCFLITVVSLDVRDVNCLLFMQFECVCIPISTLTHSGIA